LIPLGEQHLRLLVREYVPHYNLERNHQGLGNRLLAPQQDNAASARSNAVKGSAGCSTSINAMPLDLCPIEFWDSTPSADGLL
jgi:hypothetical protein